MDLGFKHIVWPLLSLQLCSYYSWKTIKVHYNARQSQSPDLCYTGHFGSQDEIDYKYSLDASHALHNKTFICHHEEDVKSVMLQTGCTQLLLAVLLLGV